MPDVHEKALSPAHLKVADGKASAPHNAPKPTGYKQSEIEQIASLVAKAVGFLPGNDLTPLVEKLGGQFRYLDTEEYFFKGGTARIVIDSPGKFVISLHKLGGLFNNRFAIAHELGHYFLHSKMGQIPITATHSEKSVSPEEWEATVFAAALLMPRSEVKRLSNQHLSDYDLSATFSVSPEAVSHWKKMIGV